MVDINALAHELAVLKNNFKEYLFGSTYNGVLLTCTGVSAAIANLSGKAQPFKTINGNSYISFTFACTSAATTTLTANISGIMFDNTQLTYWPLCSPELAVGTWTRSHTDNSQGNGGIRIQSGSNTTAWVVGGYKIKLTAWPTWADVV